MNPKVKYIGSWADYSGYGEANRQIIYALDHVGVELTTERVSFVKQQADYGKPHILSEKLERKPLEYDIVIIHLTPDNYMNHLEPGKYHIGHLFWETDRIPKLWSWYANRLDEIWTGSKVTKEALIRSGVRVPIFVIPQPIETVDTEIFDPYIVPNHRGFMFYAIFEWTQRKNPEKLLEAYWREFEGDDNVSLLLKTFRDDYSPQTHIKIKNRIEEIRGQSKVRAFPRILYNQDLLTKEEMLKLHFTGDCFVSTHRGEGWGRPQMEAMMMGKPIISTNYGGIHEFLDEKTAYLVDYEMVPVTEEEDRIYYTKDQNWAECDIDDLRGKMRRVYESKEKARKIGENARLKMTTSFTPDKIGEKMKNRLLKISENL